MTDHTATSLRAPYGDRTHPMAPLDRWLVYSQKNVGAEGRDLKYLDNNDGWTRDRANACVYFRYDLALRKAADLWAEDQPTGIEHHHTEITQQLAAATEEGAELINQACECARVEAANEEIRDAERELAQVNAKIARAKKALEKIKAKK